MTEWSEPDELEKRMKKLGGPSIDITSPNGEKYQTVWIMLQAHRLREQVGESQKLARYTNRMAWAVIVTAILQVGTLIATAVIAFHAH